MSEVEFARKGREHLKFGRCSRRIAVGSARLARAAIKQVWLIVARGLVTELNGCVSFVATQLQLRPH